MLGRLSRGQIVRTWQAAVSKQSGAVWLRQNVAVQAVIGDSDLVKAHLRQKQLHAVAYCWEVIALAMLLLHAKF